MAIVTCSMCKNFNHPAAEYERNSMGSCQLFEAWLDKFPRRRPKPKDYDKNYEQIGGKVWMPLIPRKCSKFITVEK